MSKLLRTALVLISIVSASPSRVSAESVNGVEPGEIIANVSAGLLPAELTKIKSQKYVSELILSGEIVNTDALASIPLTVDRICFRNAMITAKCLTAVGKINGVYKLSFVNCKFDTPLDALNATSIPGLSIVGCKMPKPPLGVDKLRKLDTLELDCDGWDGQILESVLSPLTQLKDLSLINSPKFSLAGQTHLTHLSLCSSRIPTLGDGGKFLRGLKVEDCELAGLDAIRPENLSLLWLTRITVAPALRDLIERCPAIVEIGCAEMHLTAAEVDFLLRAGPLDSLTLRRCKIQETGAIKGMPKLDWLEISGCVLSKPVWRMLLTQDHQGTLKNAVFADSNLGDAELMLLFDHTMLRTLSLKRSLVTMKALEKILPNMQSMTMLDVRGLQLSENDVDELNRVAKLDKGAIITK